MPGVGFALPSNTVVQVYNQLTGPEHRVQRGSIGIEFNAQENPAISRVYGVQSGYHGFERGRGQPGRPRGIEGRRHYRVRRWQADQEWR